MSRLRRLAGRAARIALSILACVTLVSPGMTAPASATLPGASQLTEHVATTNAARQIDLSAAPVLKGLKSEPPDNYLHNNISWAAHLAAKARAAAQLRAAQRKLLPRVTPNVAYEGINHQAVSENNSGFFPPDGDIAVSPSYVVHMVNNVISIYNKSLSVLLKRANFATFYSNSSDFIFDPRVYWDPYWDRFIVLCDGDAGSGATGQSYLELAISQTNNPTGGYWIYRFAVTPEGDFFDFPDMGMDQDAIIISGNDFTAAGGFDTHVFSLSKALMYSGRGTGFVNFSGIGCTVAPPYVLDNNGTSYILSACPNDNKVYLGAMTNTSRSNPTLNLWQAEIPVPAYTVPADAPQPGVNYTLETNDNEFEQRSVQLGTRIWNVHTVQDGTATPRWYEFDTSANRLVADNIWFASGTSSDWRASIVMNPNGQTFGTWMSTDPAGNKNVSLHFNGGTGDSAGSGAGGTLYTSTLPLTNQNDGTRHRNGDYSYITLDPSAYGSCAPYERAWLEGEDVPSANIWGTRIGLVGNC